MTCHFNSSAQILLFLLLFPHAYFSNRNNGVIDRHNSNLIFSSSRAFPSFPYLILEAQKMVVLNPSICSTLLRATATSEFPSPSEKAHFPTPASFSSHSHDFFLSQRKKTPYCFPQPPVHLPAFLLLFNSFKLLCEVSLCLS